MKKTIVILIMIIMFSLTSCNKETKVKINYQNNGEIIESIETVTNTEVTSLYQPQQNGYTFEGWYNGEEKVTSIQAGTTGELTLNAQWTLTEYQITYENTKDVPYFMPSSYNIDSETINLVNLEKERYTFEGWYLNNEKVTNIPKGTTGNLTLEARWTPFTYTITYLECEGVENNNPLTYNIESDKIYLLDISKEDYSFLGWYDAETGTNKINSIEKGTLGNITLVAKWTPYALGDITYDQTKTAININQELYPELLFNPKCIDTDGNIVPVDALFYGYVAGAVGEIIYVTLTATSKGKTSSTTIENIKIYGTPIIESNLKEFLPENVDLSSLFTGKDSFGENLEVKYEIVSGELKDKDTVKIKTTVVDPTGYEYNREFDFLVLNNVADIFITDGGTITGLNNYGMNFTHLDIPSIINGVEITTIGAGAFSGNINIVSVTIPDSVTSIEERAFHHCLNLTSVNIPYSVTSIGSYAFYSCRNLTSIFIPITVMTIGYAAFGDNITKILVSCEIGYEDEPDTWDEKWNESQAATFWSAIHIPSYYHEIDRIYYYIKNGEAIVANAPFAYKVVNIPEKITIDSVEYKVTTIGIQAFKGDKELKELHLSSGITTIEVYAFASCPNLETIYIPSSVTTIGSQAFANCNKLIINCVATSQPSGWASDWNSSNRTVNWGYIGT